jgi:hypothetical protein
MASQITNDLPDYLADSCNRKDQEHDEQQQEEAGKELRDCDRRARNRGEAQEAGDDTDDKKQQCQLQHVSSFCEDRLRVLYLHALEVVVSTAFVAAEVEIGVLVHQLVITEWHHFFAFGPGIHRAAERR